MSIPGLVSGNTTTNSQSTNISIEVPIDMSNMQNGTQLDEQALADNVEAQVVKGVTKALAKANYNINTRPLSS